MVEYASLKKKHTGTAMAAVSLALCVVLSASMLFSRLTAWLPSDPQHYIPLTVSNGLTTVVSGQRTDTGDARFRSLPGQPVLLAASPFLSESWFQVFDENTVWSGETDIEIFRLSYENGDGQVTVNSNTGHKLLAPGTSNTYAFTLENTPYPTKCPWRLFSPTEKRSFPFRPGSMTPTAFSMPAPGKAPWRSWSSTAFPIPAP